MKRSGTERLWHPAAPKGPSGQLSFYNALSTFCTKSTGIADNFAALMGRAPESHPEPQQWVAASVSAVVDNFVVKFAMLRCDVPNPASHPISRVIRGLTLTLFVPSPSNCIDPRSGAALRSI
jgi:hypothetical protein